jgi:AcrR family transcriptional regulator
MRTAPPNNATYEKILMSTSGIFFANGYRGITMDELAGHIGVSKKTIYVYFPTKADLLRAVLQRRFTEIYTNLEKARQENEDNTVKCLLAVLAQWQVELTQIQPVFWREIQTDATEFLGMTKERRQKIVHDIFGRIINDGIERGDIRHDLNPLLIADMLLAAAEGIIRSGKAIEYNLTPKDLLLLLVRLVIEGSMTDAGREKWKFSHFTANKNNHLAPSRS